MRSFQVTSLVGPDGVDEVDAPEPGWPGAVLVEVHAAGVSFPDLLQTRGAYQVRREVPFVLGVEAAGIVRSAPEGSGLAPGDRVAVLAMDGTWADVVAAHPSMVFRLPDAVSLVGGAGVLMNYLTAHFALVRRGRCRAGETLLVHGAAGGVGVAALQVGRALGLRTVAVVSDPAKAQVARDAGADETVLVDGWVDEVRRVTGGRGADLVLDPVGGDRATDSLRVTAEEGRLLVVGFAAGSIPSLPLNRLLLRNLDAVGVVWGGFLGTHPAYPREQWAELEPMLADGRLRAVEGPVLPAAQAREALALLESRQATGKVALRFR